MAYHEGNDYGLTNYDWLRRVSSYRGALLNRFLAGIANQLINGYCLCLRLGRDILFHILIHFLSFPFYR